MKEPERLAQLQHGKKGAEQGNEINEKSRTPRTN